MSELFPFWSFLHRQGYNSGMKFPTEPRGRKVHSYSFTPPWGDMDALGHVNNTKYFSWCEQARISWLEKLKRVDYLSGKAKTGPVVINAACTFHKQVVYPCTMEMTVYAGDAGRSSFVTYYEMRGAEDGELRATGAAKIVWVDYAAEKAIPLPEDIRAAVE